MTINIDGSALANKIDAELRAMHCMTYIDNTRFALLERQGMQVQILITREDELMLEQDDIEPGLVLEQN